MGSPSYFRIGADVELWRVPGHLCVLLLFLVALEQLLHRAEHALLRFRKLRKVYRELMILGLLSLGIKAVKALALADDESKNMLAFQAADIVIFFSALALILQAIFIFTALRRHNKRLDKYELLSTRDLAERVSHHEAVLRTKAWLLRHWPWTRSDTNDTPGGFSSAQLQELTRLRGLPEFFPFAKYLRHEQDHQISHMFEVEITVWVLLMGVCWLLDASAEALEDRVHSHIEGASLVAMVAAFAWGVTLLHALLAWYLRGLLRAVLAACGYKTARDRLKCLRRIADDEERQLASDVLDNAVERMQRVQDAKELEQVHKDAKYSGLARHDTRLSQPQRAHATARPDLELGHASISTIDKPRHEVATPASAPTAPTGRFFSRKVIHFAVKLLLVLNGFFFALLCQAVLYDLPPRYHEFGALAVALVPLPLVVNIFVWQPRIFCDYVLVACLFKVDVATLSDVISQFSESIELRTEFVGHLTSRMHAQGQTLADLRRHFHASDPHGSGRVELEQLRQILRHVGCQVSYFRFNDVARLLFRLHGTSVEYAQVERLLELADMEDHARASVSGAAQVHAQAPHYMRTVMTEEAELHQRARYSTMEPGRPWPSVPNHQHDTIAPSPALHFPHSASFAGVPLLLTPITPPLAIASPAPVMAYASSPRVYHEADDPHYLAHL